jgi:hypothetical protein
MRADCNDLEARWASDAQREYADAMLYEAWADYDRYDGMRGDVDYNDDPGCPVCGYVGDCAECIKAKEDYERAGREAFEARVDSVDSSDVPF